MTTSPFSDNNPVQGIELGPTLFIRVGEIEVAEDNKYVDDGDAQTIYTDYEIHNRYEFDPHRYMLGLTSPGGFAGASVGFVQLASPTLLWVADWTASRTKNKPKIPPTEVDDPDWVFLGAIPELADTTIAPDGVTPVYRISGTYVYGHKSPSDDVYNNAVFPRPAWSQDVYVREITNEDKEGGLITKQGGAGLGAGVAFGPGKIR